MIRRHTRSFGNMAGRYTKVKESEDEEKFMTTHRNEKFRLKHMMTEKS